VARVTTFTSAPMDHDREFAGQGIVVLHASTDQSDLDVLAKVSLLRAGAPPLRISQGWLRASRRAEDPELTTRMRPFHTHREAESLEPGRVYELRVELLPMSVLAREGDRIRLGISNADSMIADAPMTHWYGQKAGTDTYHRDTAHPSALVLHERPSDGERSAVDGRPA
jgi:uncharacterized protein